jgi:hypothetical protein
MLKRIFIISSITVILLVASPLTSAAALVNPIYQVPDLSRATGEKILEEIDEQMKELYGVDPDFFKMRTPVFGEIRYDFLKYDIKRLEDIFKRPVLFSPVMYDSQGTYTHPTEPLRSNPSTIATPVPGGSLSPTPPMSIGTIRRSYSGLSRSAYVPVWGLDAYGQWYIDWDADQAYWFENGWSGYRFNGCQGLEGELVK